MLSGSFQKVQVSRTRLIHLIPPSAPSLELPAGPQLSSSDPHEDWQSALRGSLRSLEDLEKAGWITPLERNRLTALKVENRTKIRIPEYYASLITPNRSDCPIRLQAIPGLLEIDPQLPEWLERLSVETYGRTAPWTPDPIGDLERLSAPRLTHRYRNRALLHLSSSCAMYCRFCFRKEHLGNSERELYSGSLDPALHYLRAHPEVRELILTGGDPLSLSDGALLSVLSRISEQAPQIRVLRFHSRMAVTLPQRLTPALAECLGKDWPFQIQLVSHFNHPLELTALAQQGLRRMARKGITLWNQNVLLRGINDSPETLEGLYQTLYEWGVAPFYLHHPDLTPATFGFRTSIAKGRALMRALKGRLPGPAIPDYVLDVPGGQGKVPLLDTERVVRVPCSHSGSGSDSWPLTEGDAGALNATHGTLHVYEVLPSETRQPGTKAPIRYLDLFPSS